MSKLRVWIYNLVFQWLHRRDAHVRTWQVGERCSGCEELSTAHDACMVAVRAAQEYERKLSRRTG